MSVAFLTLIFSAIAMFFSIGAGVVGFGLLIHKKKIEAAIKRKDELDKQIKALLSEKADLQNKAAKTNDQTEKFNFLLDAARLNDKIEALEAEKK